MREDGVGTARWGRAELLDLACLLHEERDAILLLRSQRVPESAILTLYPLAPDLSGWLAGVATLLDEAPVAGPGLTTEDVMSSMVQSSVGLFSVLSAFCTEQDRKLHGSLLSHMAIALDFSWVEMHLLILHALSHPHRALTAQELEGIRKLLPTFEVASSGLKLLAQDAGFRKRMGWAS